MSACEHYQQQISQLLDGELPPEQVQTLRAHLRTCPECQRVYDDFRALQAAGDIQFPILLGIASQWGVAVALSYLLAVTFKLGVVGVWLAMMIDEVLRAILFLMRWYSGKWKKQNLIEN